MFKNYLKTALRNLWKNRVYSALNIAGLAIGMAACILILLFVRYERSFDDFETKNVYRLNEVQKFEGMVASQKVALSMYPMGSTLEQDFPEIRNVTRIHWTDQYQLTYGDKIVFLPQSFFVDSTFLQVFDFTLLKGDRTTVLQDPNTVVLTETTAKKLFGNSDPIGKTVTHFGSDTTTYRVTGVIQDAPANSQLQFDALYSFSTYINMNSWAKDNWGSNWLDTYLVLAPLTNVAALERKFPEYLKRHIKGDGWKQYQLFLLPLRSVHAGSADIGLDYLNYRKFDKTYTDIFFAIALIVLAIACTNFMNLSTARSAERAREVGVRKSVGAYRRQLSLQFISESVVLVLIALVLALILAELCLPYVNRLSQRDLRLPLFTQPLYLLTLIAGAITLGALSGLYPAVYLSAFRPVKVLKGGTGRNRSMLRNVLVVTQFSSAIFLMIATLFAVRQLRYMQHRDPGFVRDQVVTIPFDETTFRKFEALKQELLTSSLVSGVTGAQDVLGSHLDQSGVEFRGDGPVRDLTSTRLIVDHDYLSLYKIQLVLGRNFSSDPAENGKEYIINEALARELLMDSKGKPLSFLLGKQFGFDSLGRIVGIARDFNFNSLHYKVETMFLYNQKDFGFSNMSVRIDGHRAKDALAFIQSVWRRECPGHPMSYQFLDDHFAEVYRADSQVSQVVGILATLAIFISCLGLFGLASYSAEKRAKEVSIRKVLGASVQGLVTMLSFDFLRYVIISALIALPLAWYAVHRWLEGYAYRVDLSWWIFVAAVAASLLIAWGTIGFRAIRAAMASPVKSLRTE